MDTELLNKANQLAIDIRGSQHTLKRLDEMDIINPDYSVMTTLRMYMTEGRIRTIENEIREELKEKIQSHISVLEKQFAEL